MVTGDLSDNIDVYPWGKVIPQGHETARIPMVTGREGGPIACVPHIFCTFFCEKWSPARIRDGGREEVEKVMIFRRVYQWQ